MLKFPSYPISVQYRNAHSFFVESVIVLKGSNNLEKRFKARWAHLTPAPWCGHYRAHGGTTFRFASPFAEVAYQYLMCDLPHTFQVADFTCIAANTIEDLQYSHFSILY